MKGEARHHACARHSLLDFVLFRGPDQRFNDVARSAQFLANPSAAQWHRSFDIGSASAKLDTRATVQPGVYCHGDRAQT